MIITITRIEGPNIDCDKPCVCNTFAQANERLRVWSHTAPKNGCYDKCDFKIKGDDGELIYTGRYDLKHWRVECANLKAHVISYLEYRKDYPKSSQDDRDRAEELIEFFKDKV